MTSCPHVDGMAPVNAGDILHLFRYLPEDKRPEFYRLADWPQLFFQCYNCGTGKEENASSYAFATWEQALEWAEEHAGA